MTANDWTAICDKPHDIRLIVADMDGTLLDGDSNIPDDFWPLLDELHAKGVEFVPASGRQLATLRSMFADRVDGAMSYIAENGNVVVADDNVIDVHGVSWDITRTLIDLVDAAVASGSHDIGLVVCGLNTAYIQRQDRPFVEECSKYYKALRIVDDQGQALRLAQPARRIVSLAPHITELLYAAGAGERVVGAVQYSDHPEAAKKLPRVGGYSAVDMEQVIALKPDLVVAWKSGNRNAHLDKLRALGIPVFINEPRRIDDVAKSLAQFGRLAGTDAAGDAAAKAFRARHAALVAKYSARPRLRLFYEAWNRPLMTINGEHLISDVIRLCGGDNVFARLPVLAPTVDVESVLATQPEVIVASGMGEGRPEWLDDWRQWARLPAVARGNLFFIPPDLIQRHTPRILDGAEKLCAHLDVARSRRPQK